MAPSKTDLAPLYFPRTKVTYRNLNADSDSLSAEFVLKKSRVKYSSHICKLGREYRYIGIISDQFKSFMIKNLSVEIQNS